MVDREWEEAEKLLTDWLRRAREGQHSHYEAGKACRAINYWLGVPVILITTTLGTTAFATLEQQVSGTTKAWYGALSLLAAALTVLQTHFAYSERSEQHKYLGAEYGNIRREIEMVLALPPVQRNKPEDVLNRIRIRLDSISNQGHVVPRRIFERTLRRLARRDKTRQQA